MGKGDANLMQSAHAAPRCRARSKRSGRPCRAPAVRGWSVCRMHGARGGAPAGQSNGSWRHGGRSRETVAARREVNALLRAWRKLEQQLDDC